MNNSRIAGPLRLALGHHEGPAADLDPLADFGNRKHEAIPLTNLA